MIRELRSFVAVAEAGSINAAARRLRLTQPAITRQIQRLEQALGTDVLDRQVRPPALNASGRALLEHCRRILSGIDDLRALARPDAEPAGRFRLGIGPMFCDSASVGPLIGLRQRFPKLELQVTSAWSQALFEEVRAGRIDAAVGVWPSGQGAPGGVESRVFAADRLVVVAAGGDPVAERASLQQLGGRAWILNPDGCGFRAALRASLTRAGMPLNVAVETPRLELQLELVSHGLGIGLVPYWAFQRSARRDRLRIVQVRELRPALRYMVVDAGLPANLAPVLDFLAGAYAGAMSEKPRATPRRRT